MTATVDATITTVQGDGGGDGKSITTPVSMSGKRAIVLVGSSSNADTIGTPASGTWAEVDPGGDKVVTTSGGQFRVFEGRSLSGSTAYAFTLSGGRRTVVAQIVGNEDDSGASCVDVAGSLESAAGSTHAPPSLTPTAANELVLDFLAFRHFAPDTSTGTPPSTGLTWTEDADARGADSNNNVQVNAGHATAGSSGVAISTAPWNTDDPFEPAMVYRVVIKSAAGGGSVSGAATLNAAPTLTAAGTQVAPAAATLSAAPTLSATATRVQPAAAALSAAVTLTAAGTATIGAAATLGAAVTLSAAAQQTVSAAATLQAAPTLTAAATRVQPAAATLTAAPTLTTAGTRAQPAAASLAAAVTLSAAATREQPAGVLLSAAPILSAAGLATRLVSAVLSAAPTLTAAASGPVVAYETATLTPGDALGHDVWLPGLAAAVGFVPGVAAPATLTPGNL